MITPSIAELWTLLIGSTVTLTACWIIQRDTPIHKNTLFALILSIPFFAIGTGSKVKIDAGKVKIDLTELESKITSSMASLEKQKSDRIKEVLASAGLSNKGEMVWKSDSDKGIVQMTVPPVTDKNGVKFEAQLIPTFDCITYPDTNGNENLWCKVVTFSESEK